MAVKYIVNLSAEEREHLYQITSKGKTTGRIVIHSANFAAGR
jgi:hypothetical protein